MAKLESDYKSQMVKDVVAAGGYGRRIEDKFAVGVLDLILCLPTTGVILAEAKKFSGKPGSFFEPTPRQYIEMCRIDDGGGVALIIGVDPLGRHYLHKTNRDDPRRGRVRAENCVVQRDGESFPRVLQRWHKETHQNGQPDKPAPECGAAR